MDNETYASRSICLEQIAYLQSLLADEGGFEQQVDAYLQSRQALAEYFRLRSVEELRDGGPSLTKLKEEIGLFLQSRLAGRAPGKLLEVRGYGRVHQILFRYLDRHVNDFVSGERLRVLTGDQVHTERRVRELRDLGLDVRAKRVAGQNQYSLNRSEADLSAAARYQLRKNLEADGGYSEAAIALLMTELH